MSDVSKTNELIRSLNRVAGLLDEYAFENNASEAAGLMREAADALATHVSLQGERNELGKIRQNDAKHFAWSDEQVEAAAKAMHETGNPWFAAYGDWGAAGFEIKKAFRESARAALAAAAGAVPVQPSSTVDEGKIEQAAIAGLDAVNPTWRATGTRPSPDDLKFTRAVVEAIGGERRAQNTD